MNRPEFAVQYPWLDVICQAKPIRIGNRYPMDVVEHVLPNGTYFNDVEE